MKFRPMLALIGLVGAISMEARGGGTGEDTLLSTNLLGVLRTAFGANYTVIAVPWVSGMNGEIESPVAVGDLIQTANLDVGDMLYAYTRENDGKKGYDAWKLQAGGDGVKRWTPVTVVSDGDKITNSPESSETFVPRGAALILHRANPKDDSGNLRPIYLKGVLAKAKTVSYTLPNGEMSLIAPPSVEGQTFKYVDNQLGFLNDSTKVVFENVNEGDKILIPTAGQPVTISRKSGQWYLQKLQANILKLPAGTGMWYKSAGQNDVTVTWKAGIPGSGSDK